MDLLRNTNLSTSGILSTATSLALFISGSVIEKDVVFYKHSEENGERTPIFTDVGILSCEVQNQAKLMEHPIEDGAVVVDHEIMEQIIINCNLLFKKDFGDKTNDLETLFKYFKNGLKIDVKTKTEFCKSMVINSKPYSITSEVVDKIIYKITLKQVLSANTKYLALPMKKVKNAGNSSTSKGGNIQAIQNNNQSLLLKLKNKAGGLL